MKFPKGARIDYENGETISDKQLFSTVQQKIEHLLTTEIAVLKQNDSEKQLTQTEISNLLAKVNVLFKKYCPWVKSYYMADYCIDRKEMLAHLDSNASHHYRKNFLLKADADNGYTIVNKDIGS